MTSSRARGESLGRVIFSMLQLSQSPSNDERQHRGPMTSARIIRSLDDRAIEIDLAGHVKRWRSAYV